MLRFLTLRPRDARNLGSSFLIMVLTAHLLVSLCFAATPVITPSSRFTVESDPDSFADLGNPDDETLHNLVGWGEVSGCCVVAPSGDLTKRYMSLRGDNSLVLGVETVGVPYVLKTEVEDGMCTDNFEIYIDGRGPVYRYNGVNAGRIESPSQGAGIAHEVLVSAEYFTSRLVNIMFRNTSTDDCGLAGVYNVRLTPAETEFDFDISVQPPSQSLQQGESASYTVNVNLKGGRAEAVTLALSGIPSGVAHALGQTLGTPSFSTSLELITSADIAPGQYLFTVSASGGGVTRSASATLEVMGKPSDTYVLTVDWIVDGVFSKRDRSEHEAGKDVTLTASDIVNDAAFLYWRLDGTDKKTGHEISVKMGSSHYFEVFYISRSALSSFADDVKNANIEDLNGERFPLFSYDGVRAVMYLNSIGIRAIRLGVEISGETSSAILRQGPFVLSVMFDIAELVEIHRRTGFDYERQLADYDVLLRKLFTQEATTILCAAIFFVGTPVLGAACLLGQTVGFMLSNLLDGWISSKVREIIGRIKDIIGQAKENLSEAIGWLQLLSYDAKEKLCQALPSILQKALCGHVRVRSDAKLMLIDSMGRRVGGSLDGGQWRVYNEIPNAWYSGLDSHPQYVVVADPEPGAYRFVITGKEPGSFQLTVTSIVDRSTLAEQQHLGAIDEGQTQEFLGDLKTDGNIAIQPLSQVSTTTTLTSYTWGVTVSTDRTVYAPGEAVQISGTVTGGPAFYCPRGATCTVTSNIVVQSEIQDPSGSIVHSKTFTWPAMYAEGEPPIHPYSDSFTLSSVAAAGTYQVTARASNGQPPVEATSTFQVQATPSTVLTTAPTAAPRGCVVATAAYGSELASEVVYMRYVRDKLIGSSPTGKMLVDGFNTFYYSWSPSVAGAIAGSPPLRVAFRVLLLPLVGVVHGTALMFTAIAGMIGSADIASATGFVGGAVMVAGIYIFLPALAIRRLHRFLQAGV